MRRLFATTMIACAALLASQVSLAQPKAGDLAEADRLFEHGKAQYNAGKKQEAYADYQRAWAIKKTHDIAANLAQVEIDLDKSRDAATHLSYAITHYPPTAPPERLDTLKRALAKTRQQTAAMTIVVDVKAADVRVDGASVGASPLEEEVFVNAGTHIVAVSAPGYVPDQQSLELAKGATKQVTFTLKREAGPAPTGGPSAPPPPPPEKSTALLVAGYGLSGVLVVGGAVFLGLASGAQSDKTALQTAIAADHGSCPAHPKCGELSSKLSSLDTMTNAGAIGLIAGGAGLALTTVYLVWPRATAATTKQGFRVTPWVGPTNGVAFAGKF